MPSIRSDLQPVALPASAKLQLPWLSRHSGRCSFAIAEETTTLIEVLKDNPFNAFFRWGVDVFCSLKSTQGETKCTYKYKVYEMLNVELQLYSALTHTGKTNMLQAIFVRFTTIRSHHEAVWHPFLQRCLNLKEYWPINKQLNILYIIHILMTKFCTEPEPGKILFRNLTQARHLVAVPVSCSLHKHSSFHIRFIKRSYLGVAWQLWYFI